MEETARLKGGLVLDGRDGPGSGSGADRVAAARLVMLLEAVIAAAPGAGGKTTELFFPTVARTFDTASLSVDVVAVALGGLELEVAAGTLTDKMGSDGRLLSG
jgi:hypothetical protein